MNKKAGIAVVLSVAFLAFVGFINAGDKEEEIVYEKASVEVEKKDIYEVLLEENGLISVYILSSKEKKLIKTGKTAPLRDKDHNALKQGILTDDLEEALMIFEDFIS